MTEPKRPVNPFTRRIFSDAFRQMVEAVGGVEAAGEILGVAHTTISRRCAPYGTDNVPPEDLLYLAQISGKREIYYEAMRWLGAGDDASLLARRAAFASDVLAGRHDGLLGGEKFDPPESGL